MESKGPTRSILQTPLEKVDLSTRTANCCQAAGLLNIGQLAKLSSLDIMSWRNAGQKTLREIREILGSIGLKLTDDRKPTGCIDADVVSKLTSPVIEVLPDMPAVLHLEKASQEVKKNLVYPLKQLPLSVRARNITVRLEVRYLGDLAQLSRERILSISNAGKRTLQEIQELLEGHGLQLGTSIPDWSRDKAIKLEKELRNVLLESAKNRTEKILASVDAKPVSLETELRRLVRAVETERNTDVLLKLWGWSGKGPRVLDSVGQEYALTRERVRQIEARALERFIHHQFDLPFLRQTIGFLKQSVPALDSVLAKQVRDAGLSNDAFDIWGLKVAAETFGLRWPFDSVTVKSKRMLVGQGDELRFRSALGIARRRTSDRGLTSVVSLASEAGIDEERIPGLKIFLQVAGSIEWLDDAREWLFAPSLSRNRLFNICSKVLAVCPTIRVTELRRAVGKSRRLAMVPPLRILSGFIQRTRLGTVSDDGVITANPEMESAIPSDSVEGMMIAVLDQHGPLMDGEIFARRSVEAGVNPISFYIYRANSPLISALGKAVYCKVGAEVVPGMLEGIINDRRTSLRISEHGWTPSGRLWFGFELSLQTLTAGGIRLASFVADLVQGSWQVNLPDGTMCGEVNCKDNFIWSFRKAFGLMGAEVGDMAAFEFDLKARQVFVRIGGPGLFEQIENPGTLAEEEDDPSVVECENARESYSIVPKIRRDPSR
jgi:Bacterial RNA polymerase, alpha chain C terminal domain/Sigma-70, region 4